MKKKKRRGTVRKIIREVKVEEWGKSINIQNKKRKEEVEKNKSKISLKKRM